MFGRRRWSLFGKIFLRHFNELDHELIVRLNRAYLPAVKYMDLFVLPVATILARLACLSDLFISAVHVPHLENLQFPLMSAWFVVISLLCEFVN